MRLIPRLRPIALILPAALALAAAPAEARRPPAARPPAWLEGFDRNADDLPRAVALLEHRGGLVTEIRFDGRGGHPGFDAAQERAGRVEFVRVERGGSRYVALPPGRRADWMSRWRTRKELAAALHVKVGLSAAVRQAESDAGNLPAVAAAIATKASDPLRYAPAYNVLLLTPNDAVRRVAVDARTGLSVGNLGALAAWPQPLPQPTPALQNDASPAVAPGAL